MASARHGGPVRTRGPAAAAVGLALALSAGLGGQGSAAAAAPAGPADLPDPPAVSAPAAAVLDTATGRVLYAKAATERRPIASTTKIMTALVALEAAHPDDLVTVPAEAARVRGSRIFLEAGEVYRLEDLLIALMVSSANDAAVAIAVHVDGSVEGFVARMNATVAALGLTDTAFANPHGLDDEGHYSSALDLARLAAHAMQNPAFRRLAALKEARIPYPAVGGIRTLRSHNYLLTSYPGATGIKTGWTTRSGYCIVGAAERDGREVVAVILGAESRTQWVDMSRLLGFGLDAAPALDTRLPPPDATAARQGVLPRGAPAEGGSSFRGVTRLVLVAGRVLLWAGVLLASLIALALGLALFSRPRWRLRWRGWRVLAAPRRARGRGTRGSGSGPPRPSSRNVPP